MKNYGIQHWFIALCALFILASCEDIIEVELEDKPPVLNVEGFLTDELTVQSVKLSYTTNFFANEEPDYTAESGATVVLFENDNVLDTLRYNPGSEHFQSVVRGVPGNSYHLYIKTQDGTEYISDPGVMEEVTPIDSIFVEFNDDLPFGNTGYEVKLKTFEPAPKGDYYRWRVFVNDVFLDAPTDLTFAEDEFVKNDTIEFTVFFMPEEDFDEYSQLFDTIQVTVEQNKITRDYFEFLTLIQQQSIGNGGPFASPPARITGNIRKQGSDEYVSGFFDIRSVKRATVTFD